MVYKQFWLLVVVAVIFLHIKEVANIVLGGGCRDGLGATGNLDVLASEFEIDPINGESATFSKPGKEGISAANSECTFNATAGVEFQGGAGSAFGAGGI